MIRRGLAGLAAGVALITACNAPAPPSPTTPVVLITLDTTRAERLGCYGSDRRLTPNLDRLAADGVVFERAFAQAAVTPVSHASILTGLEPYHHGVRVMHGHAANRLADEQTTLAEMLEAAGYRTGAFFPESLFATRDLAWPPVDKSLGFQEMVNRDLARHAPAVLDGWFDKSGPFLVWAHLMDPHAPYERHAAHDEAMDAQMGPLGLQGHPQGQAPSEEG